MEDLNEIYQETILEHNRNPRNFGVMTDPTSTAEGYNANCGDEIKVFVHKNENNIIENIQFVSQGCAISKASASLMTDFVKNSTIENAIEKIDKIIFALNYDLPIESENFGDLEAIFGAKKFPARVKCATLPWYALKNAIEKSNLE